MVDNVVCVSDMVEVVTVFVVEVVVRLLVLVVLLHTACIQTWSPHAVSKDSRSLLTQQLSKDSKKQGVDSVGALDGGSVGAVDGRSVGGKVDTAAEWQVPHETGHATNNVSTSAVEAP